MRFIDITALERSLPEGWVDRAAEALSKVRSAEADKRAEEIRRHAGIWTELKPLLRDFGHGKCWYCEVHERRSDCAVDHFRPKGRVFEAPDHPGYWWLAFDWRNYRFSCTYCNSRRKDVDGGTAGGKYDHFPLLDPSARAYPEDEPACEAATLLDPARAADTLLLYFGDDGRVEPRIAESGMEPEVRARVSVEIYHLCHSALVDARLELLNGIRNLIRLGMACYSKWQAGDQSAKTGFDVAVEELKRRVAEKAEFSSAARDMIRGLRDPSHPWIDSI